VSALAIAFYLASAATAQGKAGTLHLSPGGSDANPCTADRPCASLDRAYRDAAPGAVIQLSSGSYGGQSIGYDAAKAGLDDGNAKDVVFRGASDASVQVDYLDITGSHITIENVTVGGWHVKTGANDITLRNVNSTERVFITSATNVSVIGGVVDGGGRYWDNGNQVKRASNSAPIPENILFDGVVIRNFRKNPSSDDHVDCLHFFSGSGITVRNSRIENCEHFGILFTVLFGFSPRNIVIENNFFDCCGEGYYALQLGGGHGEAFDNVLIRYNSSNKSITPGTDNAVSNVRFVGNNVPDINGCRRSGITSAYNVLHGAGSSTCGPNDKLVPSGFLNAGALDFHLRADAAARDAGDPSNYPATDIDGQPRPQGNAPDAGADEFDLGQRPGTGPGGPSPAPQGPAGGQACGQRGVCLQVRRAAAAPRWARRRARIGARRARRQPRLRIAFGRVVQPQGVHVRVRLEQRRNGRWKRVRAQRVKLGSKGRFANTLRVKSGTRYRCGVAGRKVRFRG
jgi:hypothetical protein